MCGFGVVSFSKKTAIKHWYKTVKLLRKYALVCIKVCIPSYLYNNLPLSFSSIYFNLFCFGQFVCSTTVRSQQNKTPTRGLCRFPVAPQGISCLDPSAMVPFPPSSSRKSLYQQLARPLWPQFVTSFRMVAGLTKLYFFVCAKEEVKKDVVQNCPNFSENTSITALYAALVWTPTFTLGGRECRACLELVYFSRL